MDSATQNDLESWFGDYNSRFFDGKLSKWKVQLGYPSDIYDVGDPNGYCARGEKILYIEMCSKEKARKTLIHEMVHASAVDWHGKRFRDELLRVKELGAPVHSLDLKPHKVPTGAEVTEIIIEFIRYRLELKKAQAEAALIFGFKSRATLMRRYPKATQIHPEIVAIARFEEPKMEILGMDEAAKL